MAQTTLERIAAAIANTPFEGRVYAVGGYVRDKLLGRPDSNDIDLVVEGDALALVQYLFTAGLSNRPPAVFENFGTASLQIGDDEVEFVTARRESYRGDSRKPTAEPATLMEDAQRRDFTVNALLWPVASGGGVVDLLGTGLSDLHARILRTPLDPLQTFEDDPLRMLRAVRFAHRLGFDYAPGLQEAIRAKAHRMAILSPERVREELMKMLAGPAPAESLADLMRLGLLDQFWPEFADGIGMEQGTYHHLDVWGHTLEVVRQARPDPWIRLACLFHDVGKPRTRTVEPDGRIRFFGHEKVGEAMAREMLARLRFSNDEVRFVAKMVRNHMRLGSMKEFTATAARRLIRDLGHDLEALLDVCDADAAGLKRGVRILDVQALRRKIEEVAAETPPQALESPLSGVEILAILGGEPGPWVGEVKSALAEEVVAGRIQPGDKGEAEEFVLGLLPSRRPG